MPWRSDRVVSTRVVRRSDRLVQVGSFVLSHVTVWVGVIATQRQLRPRADAAIGGGSPSLAGSP